MNVWINVLASVCGATLFVACASPSTGQQQGVGVKVKDGDVLLSREIAIDPSKEVIPINPEMIAGEIHVLINKYRRERGLPPLIDNIEFDKAALKHSLYMEKKAIQNGNKLLISHDLFDERMDELRAHLPLKGFAENVAVISQVRASYIAETMVQGWINSPGHHKNIIGNYNLSGVAVVSGSGHTVYSTQIFGRLESDQ